MKGFGENNNYKKINKRSNNPSIEEIINYAINFQLKGNFEEANKCYKYCIDKGIKDPRVFCNYGLILLKLGDLQNAKLMMERSIEISPNFELKYNLSEKETVHRIKKLIRYSDPVKEKKTLFIWPEGVFSGYSYDQIYSFKELIFKSFSNKHYIIFGINRLTVRHSVPPKYIA